ncbi:hypothetical protein Tco_1345223 [Tanacetum coccineum]
MCQFRYPTPMLDKTDFASWQQRIRLYCRRFINLAPGTTIEFIGSVTDEKDRQCEDAFGRIGINKGKDRESQTVDDFKHFASEQRRKPVTDTMHKYVHGKSILAIQCVMTSVVLCYRAVLSEDIANAVLLNNASMVLNDAYVMIDNDLHKPKAQSVFKASTYTVADNSLNVELAIYKEKRREFEKGTSFVKLQLASTIQHNKLMVDEVTSLKKDFDQKENKYLEEFLDLKASKDKVEDKNSSTRPVYQTVQHDV